MNFLNPQQREAVEHGEGPVLILAGAGSGKTRVVTYRIAHLLQMGIPESQIVALTFTNKAAHEMKERVLALTQRRVLACTFHSLCARILRESIHLLGFSKDFTIYDEDDSEHVLKEALSSLSAKFQKEEVKQFRSQISSAKNALLFPEHFEKEEGDFCAIYTKYQALLKSYQALDFDDLLFLTAELFMKHPEALSAYQNRWSFILIDEYQDTNGAQNKLIELLSQKHKNVFAVGDPDQSIYSWRGANIEHILRFLEQFPGAKTISLEQNYRSKSNILQAANALISHNAKRLDKRLWSDLGEGEKICCYQAPSDKSEVAFVLKKIYELHRDQRVPLDECAIFYRTHFQSRLFEDALLKERIPYVIVGGLSFYQRKEIKDVLAWLKMVLSDCDAIAFLRTIELPKRGLGSATCDRLQLLSQEKEIPLFTLCQRVVSGEIVCKLSPKQLSALDGYVKIVVSLREDLQRGVSLSDLVSTLLEKTGYLTLLKEEIENYEERRENVAELLSKVVEWQEEEPDGSLALFLEELTLKTSKEENTATSQVKLMTLHNGKGLEFTAVFLVGMEEDLFPHVNARDNHESLEEERRLCYVGMTRAKEYLFLSSSLSRYLWGMLKTMRPSRFLREIPSEFLQPLSSAKADPSEEFGEEDSVIHPDFGPGIVQRKYHTSLGLTYDVFFPKMRVQRSFVARFAKLKKAMQDISY